MQQHRRWVAALLAGLAVYTSLQVLAPSPPQTVSVVTAAGPIAGGAQLSEKDLELKQVPAGVVPESAVVELDAVVGQTTTVPIPGGSMVTEPMLLQRRMPAADTGRVLLPVPIPSPSLQPLLQVGGRVTIAPSDSGRPIAKSVLIVALPTPETGALKSEAGVMVLDVSESESKKIVAALGVGRLSVSLG